MLSLLFGASSAMAVEFYVLPIDPVRAIAQADEGGKVAAQLVKVFGNPEKTVVQRSQDRVVERFAAHGITVTADPKQVSWSAPVDCVAEYRVEQDGTLLGALVSGYHRTTFALPAGKYWLLRVETENSLMATLGDLSGQIWTNVFSGFRENGAEVAICGYQ